MPNVPHATLIIETWAALNLALLAIALISLKKYANRIRRFQRWHKLDEQTIKDVTIRDIQNRVMLLRERELTDRLLDGALITANKTRSIPFDAETIRSALSNNPRASATQGDAFPYNPFDDPRYNDLTMKPGAES